ncbi:MAG: hypothetical protein ABW122_09620 [Ilumatobacteraceae bacterium]
MSMLVRFAPWIAFVVLTDVVDWRLGLVAGLVAALAVWWLSTPRKLGILDAAQLVFFAAVGVFAFLRPDSSLQHHMSNVSMAWFAAVAAASILIGRPFTMDFAGDDVTPEIAASSLYRSIHTTITAVWAACFAGISAAGFIGTAVDRPAIGTVATVVLLIVAIKFSNDYPDKAVAAAGVHRPADTAAHA